MEGLSCEQMGGEGEDDGEPGLISFEKNKTNLEQKICGLKQVAVTWLLVNYR